VAMLREEREGRVTSMLWFHIEASACDSTGRVSESLMICANVSNWATG